MQEFRYSLDKSSKKNICPNCNKRTFVFYVDTEKGKYLPPEFGRCDREQNCNYHKAPPKGKRAYLIDFTTLKSISTKASKLVDVNGVISIVPNSQILEINKNNCWLSEWYLKTSIINYTNNECKYFYDKPTPFFNALKTVEKKQKINQSFHSLELQNKLIENYNGQKYDDNLTTFLLKNFCFSHVKKATQNYYLTGTNYFWNNATIFWQIDENEKIHAGKIMLYNKQSGKRIKEPYNHINWLHNDIKEPEFNLKQCLFGLHLITEDYSKDIAIVESEKTAVIMSIYLPQYIWLATGSKSNFKKELLKPIKNRNCIAFPDKGEYNNWNTKSKELQTIGYKITVSNLLEKTNFENGFDLADYYLIN
jgi:hypothetical protein